MPFNSIGFAVFFALVFAVYAISGHRWQNRILLGASCLLYAAWDWRFLALLALITVVGYVCALGMRSSSTASGRKAHLVGALVVSLGALCFFKYFNFFTQGLSDLLKTFGVQPGITTLRIALPVGVSFFTFRVISYCVDVFKKEQEPTKDFLSFAVYVTFFPQLVAGPIERASHFLPQIEKPRRIDTAKLAEGTFLVLYGLFLKVVVADNLALLTDNRAFTGHVPANGLRVLICVYAFAFQVFTDFAGYSNIARGLSAFLGFDSVVNFRSPYFAVNPQEFWHRWHISLSTWLRDYVYIPLGGSRGSTAYTMRNLLLTMLLGGLWHGAAWTFVIWGGYHGLLLAGHRLSRDIFADPGHTWSPFTNRLFTVVKWFFFFNLVCIGWVFFRADSPANAMAILESVFSFHTFDITMGMISMLTRMLPYMPLLLILDAIERWKDSPLAVFQLPKLLRVLIYLILVYEIVIFGVNDAQSFIYARF